MHISRYSPYTAARARRQSRLAAALLAAALILASGAAEAARNDEPVVTSEAALPSPSAKTATEAYARAARRIAAAQVRYERIAANKEARSAAADKEDQALSTDKASTDKDGRMTSAYNETRATSGDNEGQASPGVGRGALFDMPEATASAAGREIAARQDVTVISPAGRFTGESRFENNVTLVDAAAFALFAGATDVTSDGAAICASGGGFEVTLTAGTEYVESSGRCFFTGTALGFEDGVMFAPISPLAAAFGLRAEGDGERTVRLTGGGAIAPASARYDADELYWLSRIINAESGGEPFRGKIAVGNVVLNRVRSDRYPDTVYGVIFDFTFGVQFTPAANGTVYLEPSAESVAAAKVCLEGYTLSDEIAFFFNPAIAESTWISDNRPWVMTIGNHAFYS